MQIIIDNYKIIVGIGLFILFSLIGYLIELSKKSKDYKNDNLKLDEIELTNNNDPDINKEENVIQNKDTINNNDDLLVNYDKDENNLYSK